MRNGQCHRNAKSPFQAWKGRRKTTPAEERVIVCERDLEALKAMQQQRPAKPPQAKPPHSDPHDLDK